MLSSQLGVLGVMSDFKEIGNTGFVIMFQSLASRAQDSLDGLLLACSGLAEDHEAPMGISAVRVLRTLVRTGPAWEISSERPTRLTKSVAVN